MAGAPHPTWTVTIKERCRPTRFRKRLSLFSTARALCVLAGALLLTASSPTAQQPPRVTGQVIDGATEAPLDNVHVESSIDAVITASGGRFSIGVGSTETTLRIQAAGYLDTVAPIDNADLVIRLFPNTFAETVEVVSAAVAQERPSSTPVSPAEVFRAPGSIDNVFRTLNTLPGVASTDDFGSRLAVRGGTPDQNLTMMDGIEVHNPYRLFGIASAFNPETVEDFQLSAGGFGAAYGDRLSSLLIVKNRPGRAAFAGAGSASVTDANVVLEGATPGGHDGTWLVSARRTYYDLVAGRLQDQNFPSFADLQIRAGWEFGPGHRLTVTGLRSVEDADLDIDGDRAGERAALGSDVTNGLASARFDAVLGTRATSTTIVSWYRNREQLNFDGLVRADARRSNAPDNDVAFGLSTILFDRSVDIGDVSARQELGVQLSPRHLLAAGLEVHRLNTSVGFTIRGDRNNTQANGSSIQGGAGLPDDLQSALQGTRGGVWLQDTYTPSSRVSFEPGVRLDWSTINGDLTVSPRVALSYALGGGARVRAAGGLYTQSPGYEKLTQSDYFIDLSGARERGLLHEKATHIVVGLEQTLGRNLTARIEGYHKRFNDLLLGRLENESERLERVAQYDFPEPLRDEVPTAQMILSAPTNDAGGTAYGMDVFLSHTNDAAPLTGWLSYAWGRATRESYGRRYAFEYDRRHAFNAVGRYRLTGRWDVAATLRVASGFPHTAPLGVRVSAVEDERGRLVPGTDPTGNLIYTVDYGDVGNLNAARLPHYARVDVRGTYRRGRWSLYFEVLNMLGRDNAVVLEPRLRHDPDSTQPQVFETASQGFPRIPTFGLRVRF